MWNQIEFILKTKLQTIVEKSLSSFKDKLHVIYIHIILSIVSIVVLCYSLTSLITRVADNLDLGRNFVWTYSMTLYLVLVIGSIVSLKVNFRGADSKPKFNYIPKERPVQRISRRKNKNERRRKSKK